MVPRARVKAVRSGHFAVPLKILGVERGGALQCEAGSLLDVQMPGPLLEIWTHWVWAGAGPWSSQTNLLQQVTWGSSLRGFVSCNRHLSPKELLGRWMANSLNALRIPIRVPVGVQGQLLWLEASGKVLVHLGQVLFRVRNDPKEVAVWGPRSTHQEPLLTDSKLFTPRRGPAGL